MSDKTVYLKSSSAADDESIDSQYTVFNCIKS